MSRVGRWQLGPLTFVFGPRLIPASRKVGGAVALGVKFALKPRPFRLDLVGGGARRFERVGGRVSLSPPRAHGLRPLFGRGLYAVALVGRPVRQPLQLPVLRFDDGTDSTLDLLRF